MEELSETLEEVHKLKEQVQQKEEKLEAVNKTGATKEKQLQDLESRYDTCVAREVSTQKAGMTRVLHVRYLYRKQV